MFGGSLAEIRVVAMLLSTKVLGEGSIDWDEGSKISLLAIEMSRTTRRLRIKSNAIHEMYNILPHKITDKSAEFIMFK